MVSDSSLLARTKSLAGGKPAKWGEMVAVSLAALGLVATGEAGLSTLVAAIARSAPVSSLTSLLHQRSPGRRTKGQLANTKAKKLAIRAPQQRAPGRPHQRALPKVVMPPPLPDTFVRPLFGNETPLVAEAALPPIPELLFEQAAPVFASGAPFVLFGSVPTGSGGGGSGGGGGVTVTPTAPVQTIAAVPEPDSWALMLIGFGATGVALRRRKSPALRGSGRGFDADCLLVRVSLQNAAELRWQPSIATSSAARPSLGGERSAGYEPIDWK